MFKKYLELLKKIVDGIFNKGSDNSVRFLDYLTSLWYTLLIILSVVTVLVITIALFFVPFVVFRKWSEKYNYSFMQLCDIESMTYEEYNEHQRNISIYQSKYRRFKICFWSLIVFIWIPFCIPTVLYIISLITSLF